MGKSVLERAFEFALSSSIGSTGHREHDAMVVLWLLEW
jgi:hypothetical protein